MSRIALITGASRGIGAATARLAAQAGYDVCVNFASDQASALNVVSECQSCGVRAIAVQADVGVSSDVDKMFETCDRNLGPISLLVNNAGIIGAATLLRDLPDAALQRTFEVNVFGSIYCARSAIQRMSRDLEGDGGVIINISSISATLGSPGEYVHYAASKGAIDTLTIGLSKEVGPQGIRVNAIHAGTTDTEIHKTAGNPERPAAVARAAPLGRVAIPNDIAEAVIWLASDKAGYATGAILRVGGGI